ncbi:hypothetical protein TISLANDTSLP1_18370 [Thermodesulfovibrio yellowstonii]|uniref:Uncharacterized protein n=1 Tax=Thermodesulfovibrio yellowstonii TaxID=28262 RepID=A0A9W6GF43_9BACT|nr:hypothetical protein TISLANDTSLP1_18370 [Thermodesulfovibrio islandicus]
MFIITKIKVKIKKMRIVLSILSVFIDLLIIKNVMKAELSNIVKFSTNNANKKIRVIRTNLDR